MKIYNELKNEILTNVDLTKGYLKNDRLITKTIPPQEEIQEKFHYEFKEYPNGGKDRIKIIDVPHQNKKPETYEYEEIQIFIPYTQKQLAENEIFKLKDWFESEYSYKEQKFRRLIALNKLDDDGIDAKTKLTELYIEAESKRIKIQMLENEV